MTCSTSSKRPKRAMRIIHVKPVEASDFAIWLPLWKGYQRFYEVDFEEAVTRKTWARLVDPAEPMHAALAMEGDRALGMVHAIYHRSTWTVSDDCYLQDLFVDQQARGGGVGRALIEHVFEEAERRGAYRVYWHTHESNGDAMQLYERIAERTPFVQYRKQLV